MRLVEYLRWAELDILVAVHELSHLVLVVGHGPNRYSGGRNRFPVPAFAFFSAHGLWYSRLPSVS
jgi:hypothetical protein